jgi:hypothetical protein
LASPAEIDLAIFTIPNLYGPSRDPKGQPEIPLNYCVEFGTAQLIPGASPQTCTFLHPINLDDAFQWTSSPEAVVTGWLTQFCLENGYRNFSGEIARRV